MIGPALLGVIHAVGSIFSDDVRQVVHKRPSIVYSSVSTALANTPLSGKMELEGAEPVPYQLSVDRGPGEHLVVHLMLDGRKAGQVDLSFAPENDGEDTIIIAKVESDGKVVREELAGTDKAKLGYAPDWLLTFAFGRSLSEAAEQIEKGSFAVDPAHGFSGSTEALMTVEERQQRDRWQQYQATRPSTNPNAEAKRYMAR